MLHSLFTISQNNEIELNSHNYNIFDSRTFKATIDDKRICMEDFFKIIEEDFIRIWDNAIKEKLNMLCNGDIKYKNTTYAFTPEEAIYAKIQNFSLKQDNVYVVYAYNIRIIIVKNMGEKSNFGIVESNIWKENGYYYSTNFNGEWSERRKNSSDNLLSIFISEKMLNNEEAKNNIELMNLILFRIMHVLIITYMDYRLSLIGVPLNKTWCKLSANNKDAIIIPEQISLTDARFIYYYFYTLFHTINSISNKNIIDSFDSYINIVELPLLFSIHEDISQDASEEEIMDGLYKIYKDIWNLSNKDDVSDEEYINICSDILLHIELDLDESFYNAQDLIESEEE